jgi:hypothetical protein
MYEGDADTCRGTDKYSNSNADGGTNEYADANADANSDYLVFC